MVIVPKEKPTIENLNSAYLDIQKLFEHYQSEFGTGCVHFKAPHAEGVGFFDKDELLGAVFSDGNGEVRGEASLGLIIDAAGKHNFSVSIYQIEADKIYFWANMPSAEVIYKDLSTEFTDLEGLIKKMAEENLTGFIEVSIGQGQEGGFIFFQGGKITGGSYCLTEEEGLGSQKSQGALIQKTKALGGLCNVLRISQPTEAVQRVLDEDGGQTSPAFLNLLEDLLATLEKVIKSNRKIRADFDTLLKKKFLEKVDKYPFLDPFVGEVTYSDQKLTYVGSAGHRELAKGMVESVMELAGQVGVMPQLREMLGSWSKKYDREIESLGLSL